MAPWLSSKTRTRDPLGFGRINDNSPPVNKASFTPLRRARYSASVLDNVTHLYVSLAQPTATPSRVITVPDTERSVRHTSIVRITIRSRIQSRGPRKSQSLKPHLVKVCHNLKNCLPVPLGGVNRVKRYSTHTVRGVWPRHSRQPHQTAHSLRVRPVSSRLALPSLTYTPAPGVVRISDDEFTPRPKRLNTLSTNAFCVISNAPKSQSRLKVQSVCQVSSSRSFVGIFVDNAAWKSLYMSSDPAITMSST